MTDVDNVTELTEPVDGRAARRQRNIDAVIDVVLEMFAEEAMFPTIEQAATRSGLSLRSLYRYFSDPGELLEATIKRNAARSDEIARLPAIGEGPLEHRVDEFVAMRLRLHEAIGSVYRATVANAHRHARIGRELASNRDRMRAQFELQFANELSALAKPQRTAVVSAGDLLTQLDSIDFLRRHRQLSLAEVHVTLSHGLQALLT